MSIEEAVIILLLWAGGTVLGLIITGLLADRLVIRKIMRNKDVQDALQLFRDAKDYLRQILENQKTKHEEKHP
jgi:uncharacterized membrane-anchored protein YhcB (DUF1043 family)